MAARLGCGCKTSSLPKQEGNRGNSSPCPDGIPAVPLTGHGGVLGHSVRFAMRAFIHSHTHSGRAGIEIISSENSCDAFKGPVFDRLLPSYGLKSHQAPPWFIACHFKPKTPCFPFLCHISLTHSQQNLTFITSLMPPL